MKFKFTSKSKAQAEKFQKYIKADRNLESTLTEKDGKFYVEYSSAELEISEAKFKAKKAAKKAKSNNMDKTNCSKADIGGDVCCEPEYVEYDDLMDCLSEFANYFYNEMQYQMNWVWAEIAYIENAFYNHVSTGHLPPINGAEKMTKALSVLGLGDDYEVKKPVVYASRKSGVDTFDVDFPSKK